MSRSDCFGFHFTQNRINGSTVSSGGLLLLLVINMYVYYAYYLIYAE